MTYETNEARSKPEKFFEPRRLGHTNLFVSDYERSSDFYQKVVGYEEVYKQPNNMATFLSNGNTYHDLGLTDTRSRYCSANQKPGMWHLALELESEAKMVEGYNRAKEAGVAFSMVMDHDVARSLYLDDPDGNMVELYADVEKDWREMRQGIINKEKPKWVPGVTSAPLTEACYPQEPDIVRLDTAIFHPKKISHVALITKKLDEMIKFYVDVVGLQVVTKTENFAVLKGTVGQGDLTLHRAQGSLTPGLHHVGFEVWNEQDLESSLSAATAANVAVEREMDHAARHTVTIKDPDGLRLQFFVNKDWSRKNIEGSSAEDALYLL